MKQIAWLCCPVIGTKGDVTYYEMDGQYYARKKSSLSSKRVKTSPKFRLTMVHAYLFKRASKIGAQVYKALPPGWRQFWMYRSFTGEAYTMLIENPYNDEEVKELLWKCYVEPWEQRKIIDPDNPIFQPKPKKIRKRRKYSEESIKRMLKRKDKNGKPKFIDPEEEERKRLRKEMNAACYARTIEKQQRLAEEQRNRLIQPIAQNCVTLNHSARDIITFSCNEAINLTTNNPDQCIYLSSNRARSAATRRQHLGTWQSRQRAPAHHQWYRELER